MPITATPKIWMNGSLVDWADANVHILTHTLHYGMGVFEGIRAYETADGPAVFRLTEHIERLHNSAKILGMPMPYSVDDLITATKETVASTGLDSCYTDRLPTSGTAKWGLTLFRAPLTLRSHAGRGVPTWVMTRWRRAFA